MDITAEDIQKIVNLSGLENYAGIFRALGSGEVNDSFLLTCHDQKYVVRIAKDVDQATLIKEAFALKLLNLEQAPRLVFFDQNSRIKSRLWVVETYVAGSLTHRLSRSQFDELGKVLAAVHSVKDPEGQQLNLWEHFLIACRSFGGETKLLNHEDARLRHLIHSGQKYMSAMQYLVDGLQLSLIHGDGTPSNILVDGETVNLIDWEFARFSDPMREFSTIYYDDMEYNQGKWRIKIADDEKQALFAGYQLAGGELDEKRIDFWMKFDKLGAAVFLYWRLHQSGRMTSDEQRQQYQLDLENLLVSLERNL